MNSYAPIALFVYNRPKHVKRVIEAIKKIKYHRIVLFIFFQILAQKLLRKKNTKN